MRVLAVDPGETIGYAVLDDGEETFAAWQESAITIKSATLNFRKHLQEVEPTIVVVEDYRMFASKVAFHVGIELFTAKLIGALEAVCALAAPPVCTTLIQPSKKGRWPIARLNAKFPEWVRAPQPHGFDALVLALVYMEVHCDNFP